MRLLRGILLYDGSGDEPANNAIRVTNAGTPATLTLNGGSATGELFYLSGDDQADDLLKLIQDALTAASVSLALEIIGVTIAADSSRRSGRIRAVNSEGATVALNLTHAGWTLPDGALGWAEADGDVSIANGATAYSPSPHRFGWYSPRRPNRSTETDEVRGEVAGMRASSLVDLQIWREARRRTVRFNEGVPAPFLRREASEDSEWQAAYGLSAGTQWGSWEQFAQDVRYAAHAELDIREYPDEASSTYRGPYFFESEAPIWLDPMGHWESESEPGEVYRGGFELLRIVEV